MFTIRDVLPAVYVHVFQCVRLHVMHASVWLFACIMTLGVPAVVV